MKRILTIFTTLLISITVIYAQDMSVLTNTYNKGAEYLSMGDKTSALKYFTKALSIGEKLGAPAKEIVKNCKNTIPNVVLSIAKELNNSRKYNDAIAKIKEAKTLAKKYNVESVIKECDELIPQIEVQKSFIDANKLYESRKYTEAIPLFKSILDKDNSNKSAYIRLIQCYTATDKMTEAKNLLKEIEKKGKDKDARKIIGVTYLKEALKNLQSGLFDKAIKNSEEALEFYNNSQAHLIAGQAAQKLNRSSDAIKHFSTYLKENPKDKKAGKLALAIGALYQGEGNKIKAIEYYKKAQRLGEDTQKYIDALKKK